VDVANQEVRGYVLNHGSLSSRFGGSTNYFVATFSSPFTEFGVWNQGKVTRNQNNTRGTDVGGIVGGFTSNPIEMFVSISFISIDQARENLKADVKSGQTFMDIQKQAEVHTRY
jgi:putative alpha-1,2-mannosidase